MRRLTVLVLLLVLCSCSTGTPEINNLRDPAAPLVSGLYSFEPTIDNVIENSTHIATLNLIDIEPYDENRVLYNFAVESLLAGEFNSDTITVLGYKSFYEHDETYLLFLHLASYPEYPQDIFVPFNLFTFRINNADYLDCLQQIEDPKTDKVRTFAEPFKNPEYNKLDYLTNYIKKNSKSMKKYNFALDHEDLEYLIKESDVIIEITPINLIPINPFLNDVQFEVEANYKGEILGNVLVLPNTLEINRKYIVFLETIDEGEYSLMARDSIFPQESEEYLDFISVWNN